MKHTKIYAEVLEDSALEQFSSAMSQDFVTRGALMPDAHTGYSLPIGAVVATKDIIVPSWVGYDIGCGMSAQCLNIDAQELASKSKEIFDQIYHDIPVGFNVNKEETDGTALSLDDLTDAGKAVALNKRKPERSWKHALGSLGGGNHFIEIGSSEDGRVWVVIHSGSRGIGHGIASHYMKLASPDGRAREGHYGFDVNSQEGKDYINDMNWALQFALDNRKEMIKRVVTAVDKCINPMGHTYDVGELINRNHNHAVEKDGEWIHRKGATHAEEGMMGVIPGNMLEGSFIVKGKGNPDSLYSSSHGAGRVLGRKQAKKTLDVEEFKRMMSGIQARVEESTLDESPQAYKNIYEVMALQEDLVEIVAHVHPIINIKG